MSCGGSAPPMYRAAQIANSLMNRAFDHYVRISGVQLIVAVQLVEAEYLRRTGGRPLIEGTDSLTKYSRRRVIDEWIVDTDGACLLAPEAHDPDLRAVAGPRVAGDPPVTNYARTMTDYTHLDSWNRLRAKVEARRPAGTELMDFAHEANITGEEAIAEGDRLIQVYGAPIGLRELLDSLRR